MTTPTRVLCGTDFLETGNAASKLAAGLAKALTAELVLVHAADVAVLSDYSESPAFSTLARRAMQRRIEERVETARAALAAEQDRLGKQGLKVTVDLRAGRPWRAIVEAAKDRPGLVVVGAHDVAGGAPSLLGTTASRIIHHTHQPVLVTTGTAPTKWEGINILVGVDFSRHALAAVQAARALAERFKGKVRVFYATPDFSPTPAFPEPDPELIKEINDSNQERVQSWCSQHNLGDIDCVVEPGIPEEKLLAHAIAHPTDLIVVGTRGHSRVGELLLGSTTERLLSRAPVPVLAIEAPPN